MSWPSAWRGCGMFSCSPSSLIHHLRHHIQEFAISTQSLWCMIYYFYIKPPAQTSTKFFIKAFRMVCVWVTSCTVCGRFTHSHELLFFSCGGGITQSAVLYGGNCSRKVTGWMWQDSLLHHKRVESSFYTKNVSVSGVMWTDVILDIVVRFSSLDLTKFLKLFLCENLNKISRSCCNSLGKSYSFSS